MDLSNIVNTFKDFMQKITHVEWFATAVTVVITLIITAAISHLVTKLIKKMLHVDKNPLPSSSIFVNIGRVTVWVIGICVILSTCFNVNISAAITALGIGGLAISLGFQATLSNLIGGLQITLAKLVVPGDHIMVGSDEGIVKDVTWRHTSIITPSGRNVIIPNSLINTEALTKLPPQTSLRIPIIINPGQKDLDALLKDMENSVNEAVSALTILDEKAQISLVEVVERGYKGILLFSVGKGSDLGKVKNAALSAIASHAQKEKIREPEQARKHFLVPSLHHLNRSAWRDRRLATKRKTDREKESVAKQESRAKLEDQAKRESASASTQKTAAGSSPEDKAPDHPDTTTEERV